MVALTPHEPPLRVVTATEFHELSRATCLELLAAHHFGRLAMVVGGETPLIRPVNYTFDIPSQSVVFRTGRGTKFHAILHAAKAAFEIDGIDEAQRTGWSVIVHGAVAEVTRPTDRERLDGIALEPWAPGAKPHWARIRVRAVSGRRIVLHDRHVPGQYLG